MHTSARRFFERVALHCHPWWDVLEVGSLDVNGNLRDLFDFSGSDGLPGLDGRAASPGMYVALDMRDGPNVSLVANAHALPFRDASFDMLVSSSMLEHDDRPWLSAQEMARVLKPRGLIAVSAPGFGFPRHEHPGDYWRFSSTAMEALFPGDIFKRMVSMESEEMPGVPDVFYMGKKRTGGA